MCLEQTSVLLNLSSEFNRKGNKLVVEPDPQNQAQKRNMEKAEIATSTLTVAKKLSAVRKLLNLIIPGMY